MKDALRLTPNEKHHILACVNSLLVDLELRLSYHLWA